MGGGPSQPQPFPYEFISGFEFVGEGCAAPFPYEFKSGSWGGGGASEFKAGFAFIRERGSRLECLHTDAACVPIVSTSKTFPGGPLCPAASWQGAVRLAGGAFCMNRTMHNTNACTHRCPGQKRFG